MGQTPSLKLGEVIIGHANRLPLRSIRSYIGLTPFFTQLRARHADDMIYFS